MDIHPFDAIVVGSGATGGMAALTLSEQGIKVLIIEAGPKLSRKESAINEPINTLNRISGFISKKHNMQMQHPGYWKNNPNLYANELKFPYETKKDKPFLWTQGKQFGGRSLTWGGITLRFAPDDFKPATRDGFGTNWPITYEDLSPHYEFVEKFSGIYGRKDNLPQIPNSIYMGEIPLTESEQFFGNKIQNELNYPFIQSRGFNKNASVKEEEWPRSSSIGSSLKKALKTGNVQLLPNCLVESFEINKETELATKIQLINTDNGLKKELKCNLILLCASTISTLRILLNSANTFNSSGFNDPSGKLGKCLMDHISVSKFFSIPNFNKSKKIDLEDSSLSGAGSFFIPFGSRLPDIEKIDFLRGYGIWGAIDRLGIPRILQTDPKASIGFLIAHGEVLPRESNFITLSSRKDRWGIPLPRIEFEWSTNEINMVDHMKKSMEKCIFAAGGEVKDLKNMINLPFINLLEEKSIALSGEIPPPGYYIHEVGGAQMGENENESVTDKWNRLWRCKNVFILDGACWPTSSWQSPTLTMMAITRRACLSIKKLV